MGCTHHLPIITTLSHQEPPDVVVLPLSYTPLYDSDGGSMPTFTAAYIPRAFGDVYEGPVLTIEAWCDTSQDILPLLFRAGNHMVNVISGSELPNPYISLTWHQ